MRGLETLSVSYFRFCLVSSLRFSGAVCAIECDKDIEIAYTLDGRPKKININSNILSYTHCIIFILNYIDQPAENMYLNTCIAYPFHI